MDIGKAPTGWDPTAHAFPAEVVAFANSVLACMGQQPTDGNLTAEDFANSIAARVNISVLRKIYRAYGIPYLGVGRTRNEWVLHWLDTLVAP